jgi:hypothetical protein
MLALTSCAFFSPLQLCRLRHLRSTHSGIRPTHTSPQQAAGAHTLNRGGRCTSQLQNAVADSMAASHLGMHVKLQAETPYNIPPSRHNLQGNAHSKDPQRERCACQLYDNMLTSWVFLIRRCDFNAEEGTRRRRGQPPPRGRFT